MEGSPTQPPTPPPTGESPLGGTTEERIDGVRTWVAQVDRSLGVRTYIGATAAVLALAAAIVALVLVLQLRDEAATTEDIDRLTEQLAEVSREAGQATEEDLNSIATRLDELESRISEVSGQSRTTRKELSVAQDDIGDLRDMVDELLAAPPPGQSGGSG